MKYAIDIFVIDLKKKLYEIPPRLHWVKILLNENLGNLHNPNREARITSICL